MLKADRCGHSFCAICILKWYFTHLHRSCGSWHDILECPLCRAPLPEVLPDTPRSASSCPFAPNRLADEALSVLLEQLQNILQPTEEAVAESSPSKGKGKQKGKSTSSPLSPVLEEEVLNWTKGGSSWVEWTNRDRHVVRSHIGSLSTANPRCCDLLQGWARVHAHPHHALVPDEARRLR